MLIGVLLLLLVLVGGAWFAGRRIRMAEARVDISERARQELNSRLSLLEHQRTTDLQMLDGLGEGLLALGRDQKIALANRRFAELFGTPEGIVGKPLAEVVRVSRIFEAFDRALAGEESVESFSVRSGVVERKIEMRALPLPSDAMAAVALFIDVSTTERLEQIRRNFISDFSHEVRTPLAGLRSAVETFAAAGKRLSPEEDQQLRRIMTRQLLRLERLVEDLSELSLIEAGDLSLDLRSLDLRRILDDLCEDAAEQAAHHRIRFEVSGNAVVCGDALRVQQAFSNLLDNAIKYGGDDHRVQIEIVDQPDAGIVRITDEGEGIAPSDQEKIFRRFYRIDKSRSQDTPGSGLGLAITKHLILQHRGTIDVESTPGRGATFIVRLPKRNPSLAGQAEGSR